MSSYYLNRPESTKEWMQQLEAYHRVEEEFSFCHDDLYENGCHGSFTATTLYRKTEGCLEPIDIECYCCDECGDLRTEEELIALAEKTYDDWKEWCTIKLEETEND